MFGNSEEEKKKKKRGSESRGFGGLSGADVNQIIAAQNAASGFGAGIAQNAADISSANAAIAAAEAAALAEEAADVLQEATTDAEQAAQDAAIAANAAADAVEESDTDAEQAAQDTAIAAAASNAAAAASGVAANAANIQALDQALTSENAATDAEQAAQDARLTALEADQHPHQEIRSTDGENVLTASNGQAVIQHNDADGVIDRQFRSTAGYGVSEVRGGEDANGVLGGAQERLYDGNNARYHVTAANPDMDENSTTIMPARAANQHEQLTQYFGQARWVPDNNWMGSGLIPNAARIHTDDDAYPHDVGSNVHNLQVSADRSPLNRVAVEAVGLTGNDTVELLGSSAFRIPVNSLSAYEKYVAGIELKVKDYVPGSNATETRVRMYLAHHFYDAQGRSISWIHSQYRDNTLVTLAADLNPGDTEIAITDGGAAWSTSAGSTNRVALVNWVDESGYNWGPLGYTREVINLRTPTVTDTLLTLSGAWAGRAMVAGEQIRQTSSVGGSYRYIGWSAQDLSEADNWVYNEGILHGSTEFNPPQSTAGDSILSGAADMRIFLLTRPRDLTATYTLQIGRHDLRSIAV